MNTNQWNACECGRPWCEGCAVASIIRSESYSMRAADAAGGAEPFTRAELRAVDALAAAGLLAPAPARPALVVAA
jgi:hypothetical protein